MERRRFNKDNLPEKSNKILNFVLMTMLLILFRVWHLSILQHDKKVEESQKPQIRVVTERAERAMICDRFNIPLATNKVQYNAAVCYGGIRELPRWIWQKNEEGKRVKFYYRKNYITKLSEKLAEELQLDLQRIEDLIHAKAAILGNVPCILKEDISEEKYFRLKMLENEWPGIYADIAAKRCYPLGPTAAELIGYLGPISDTQYKKITLELQELRECISSWERGEEFLFPHHYVAIEEVQDRLDQLEKKAYRINDFVGKMGTEAIFDENLRGLRGKHVYLADTRGNFVRELPGSEPPTAGQRINLTISATLQAYAEKLLIEYEQQIPSQRRSAIKRQELIPEHQPWIKGGAIIVMEPNTGEILTMASSPRFNPNDFIRVGTSEEVSQKNAKINQWLESESYLANIWNLKSPLTRERLDTSSDIFYDEQMELSWDNYLKFILPKNSPVRLILNEKETIDDALSIQQKTETLLSLFESDSFHITAPKLFDSLYSQKEHTQIGVTISLQEQDFIQNRLDQYHDQVKNLQMELSSYFHSLPLNYEKLLLIDLYRLIVDHHLVSNKIQKHIKMLSLSDYRELSSQIVIVNETVHQIIKALYHEYDFKIWRAENFSKYLKQKRLEEKQAGKRYQRPYIEYLDQAEKERFLLFWEAHQQDFLTLFLSGETLLPEEKFAPYITTLKNWAKELAGGAHAGLKWVSHYHRFKKLISPYIPNQILGDLLKTLRSFSDLNRPLLGHYSGLRGSLEKHLASAFYPTYGYGFARSHAFRQATPIGSIFKLIPAYEALRQRYLDNFCDLNPLTIIDDKHRIWGTENGWIVGYHLHGGKIPLYYQGGRLPRSEHSGIGRVDLVRALETSSNPYFAMLAGDVLEDPEDLCKAARLFGYGDKTGIDLSGEYSGNIPKDVTYNRTGLYSMAIGQHTMIGTPLQTAVMLSSLANGGEILKPQTALGEKHVRWKIFLPHEIQTLLLEGLQQVVVGEHGTARSLKQQFPDTLVNQIIGKTSTAETIERYSLDGRWGRLKSKMVWFGAIAYEDENLLKPELVVIVYLQHGNFGKDAAPLVAQMIQKWHHINSRTHIHE